jgi:ABC-type sugar transport system substrate-binding protein
VLVSRRSCLGGGGAAGVALLSGCARAPVATRIGFIVKQPEAQWFQDEWRFARAAGRKFGFEVIAIGAEDGDRVLAALNTLYARFAAGFIICAPDPRLGPAIAGFARTTGLKPMSVDDRLMAADGQPIADIPYTGISAGAIGRLAGEAAAAEAARRGWSRETTGILRISFDSLETGRERTAGAVSALHAAGYPADAVKDAPQRTSDTEGAFSAAAPVLTANARYDRWIVLGLNDETVVGGVRAAEGLSLGSADIIGVGIGGSEAAIAELAKPRATGFHASVLLSPRAHGYDTAVAMYRWITAGQAPPAVTLTSGKLLTRANYRDVLAQEGMA